jgi:hypothetical protein
MPQQLLNRVFCAGFFPTVAGAEHAVRRLLEAGFTTEQLGVIVPEKFQKDFAPSVPREESPADGSPMHIAAGASLGAALGGIALAATAVATGGASLIPGAMMLIGGGAIAGGFGSLIVNDGYRTDINEYYAQAQQKGEIVVGVHLNPDSDQDHRDAVDVLRRAGAHDLVPQDDPTVVPPR